MVDVARDEKLYFKYRKITHTHIRDSWYIAFLRLRNTESICRNSIKRYLFQGSIVVYFSLSNEKPLKFHQLTLSVGPKSYQSNHRKSKEDIPPSTIPRGLEDILPHRLLSTPSQSSVLGTCDLKQNSVPENGFCLSGVLTNPDDRMF